MITDNADG